MVIYKVNIGNRYDGFKTHVCQSLLDAFDYIVNDVYTSELENSCCTKYLSLKYTNKTIFINLRNKIIRHTKDVDCKKLLDSINNFLHTWNVNEYRHRFIEKQELISGEYREFVEQILYKNKDDIEKKKKGVNDAL